MTRLIASLTTRACSALPTKRIGRSDREQDRLGALERGRRARDDEGEVPGAHDAGVPAHGSAQVEQ